MEGITKHSNISKTSLVCLQYAFVLMVVLKPFGDHRDLWAQKWWLLAKVWLAS